LAILAALATLPFLFSRLDIALQSLFFAPGASSPWFAESWRMWRFLYSFGPWPALITGLGALVFLLATLRRLAWVRWRRHALLLILTLALGPGLLVNVIFKDHWGRPRPRQTIEFGGRWEHQSVLEKGLSGRGKSFPCGHSSMGYYFVVFYFLARRRRRYVAWGVLAGAVAYGSLMGMGRMAAGAHFASDVLWSALFPAAVAFVLYYGILRIPHYEDRPDAVSSARKPLWLLIGAPVVGLAMLAAGLAGTPAFTDVHHTIPLPAGRYALRMDCQDCDVELVLRNPEDRSGSAGASPSQPGHQAGQSREGEPPGEPSGATTVPGHATASPPCVVIGGEVQGFGWPWSKFRHRASMGATNGLPEVQFVFKRHGQFTEVAGRLVVSAPLDTLSALALRLTDGDLILNVPTNGVIPAAEIDLRNGALSAPPAQQAGLIREPGPNGTVVYRSRP
jgi:membrane-associated PAP2 superfamily phosphatase